jgi:hypothetical protein
MPGVGTPYAPARTLTGNCLADLVQQCNADAKCVAFSKDKAMWTLDSVSGDMDNFYSTMFPYPGNCYFLKN